MPEFEAPNLTKEQLVCHIVVDDRLAKAILGVDDDRAYLRGFVLRNRNTGEVRALYRFHQRDGKSWWQVQQPDSDAEGLRVALEEVFLDLCRTTMPEVENPVTCYYPPDGASQEETLEFLVKHDLVTVREWDETLNTDTRR